MSAESVAGGRLVALVCAAGVLSMTGFSVYPALLPTLRAAWGLSGAEAGFVGGAFFLGYILAVPFLSGATDRIDARSVFAASCLLAASATAAFAVLARGVVSGALFQAVTGAGPGRHLHAGIESHHRSGNRPAPVALHRWTQPAAGGLPGRSPSQR